MQPHNICMQFMCRWADANRPMNCLLVCVQIRFAPSLFTLLFRLDDSVRECELFALRRLRLLDGVDGNGCGLHGACFLCSALSLVQFLLFTGFFTKPILALLFFLSHGNANTSSAQHIQPSIQFVTIKRAEFCVCPSSFPPPPHPHPRLCICISTQ